MSSELMAEKKRPGGQKRGDKWLVMTESEGTRSNYTHSCGTTVMGARVAHSIHDGSWPGSGSGSVHNEEVPYCPKCEDKPDYHGAPIVPEGAGWA